MNVDLEVSRVFTIIISGNKAISGGRLEGVGTLLERRGQGSRETLPEIKCLPRQQEEDSAPGHGQIQPKLHKLKFQVCPPDKTVGNISACWLMCVLKKSLTCSISRSLFKPT